LGQLALQFDARVATAHTADDHLETVLMRVMRGAGARGLAGLRAPGGPLRPFLEITRAQLERYARGRKLPFVNDPSNDSRLFFRNRVRHDLLPALRRAHPALEQDLVRISAAAAAWRADVDAFVAAHVPVHGVGRSFDVALRPLSGMSSAELSVLWPAIAARFGLTLDRRGIARLSAFTIGGRVGSRVQLSGGWTAVRSRDGMTLSASSDLAPPVLSATLESSGQTLWGVWSFRPRSDVDPEGRWSSRLPSDAVLTVRSWKPGDRMRSTGGGAFRKVKQLLSRAGVTGHKRAGWPVVLAGDEIVWIPGVCRSKITERLGTAGVPFICEFIDR
jgi:tRNA(Ile)-lysidine synthase